VALCLPSLMVAASRPVTVAAPVVGVVIFLYLYWRLRKLAAIVGQLSRLPAGTRRYVLEREYPACPGAHNVPMASLGSRRTRLRAAAAAALILPAPGVFGFSLQLWGTPGGSSGKSRIPRRWRRGAASLGT